MMDDLSRDVQELFAPLGVVDDEYVHWAIMVGQMTVHRWEHGTMRRDAFQKRLLNLQNRLKREEARLALFAYLRCDVCGERLPKLKLNARVRTCSRKCHGVKTRQKKRERAMAENVPVPRVCPECGGTWMFMPGVMRSTRVMCSRACVLKRSRRFSQERFKNDRLKAERERADSERGPSGCNQGNHHENCSGGDGHSGAAGAGVSAPQAPVAA